MKKGFLVLFVCLLMFAAACSQNSEATTGSKESHHELTEKTFYSGKVSLLIPKGFEQMSEKMAKTKYPSERRPNIIYTNKAASVNVTLNYTKNKVSASKMEAYEKSLKKGLSNLKPSAKWYEDKVVTINGKKVGVLKFLTPAIDTKIYNLLFFTEMDGRLLMGSFNCPEELKEDWEASAKTILHSLKVKE